MPALGSQAQGGGRGWGRCGSSNRGQGRQVPGGGRRGEMPGTLSLLGSSQSTYRQLCLDPGSLEKSVVPGPPTLLSCCAPHLDGSLRSLDNCFLLPWPNLCDELWFRKQISSEGQFAAACSLPLLRGILWGGRAAPISHPGCRSPRATFLVS